MPSAVAIVARAAAASKRVEMDFMFAEQSSERSGSEIVRQVPIMKTRILKVCGKVPMGRSNS